MFGITDLPAYLIGATVIILLPGPNSMYCLSIAGQHGAKAAYRCIAGILLGDGILMLATALGAGTLLKLYPALFHGIKLVGGLYLAYLGWNLLRGAAQKWHFRQPETAQQPAAAKAQHIFKYSLLLSLTNPKAILFFLSFFVPFVDPDYPRPWLSFLILALILQVLSFSYLNLLIFSGSKLVQTLRHHRRTAAIGMGAVGLMFIGSAVNMWLAAV